MKMSSFNNFRGILLSSVFLTSFLLLGSCSSQPKYGTPPVLGSDIVIDIPSLPLELPKFFTFMVRERKVSFFLLKLNNGVFAFFDACASCYPQKRGYGYKDGQVICRACNMRFSIYKLEKGLGGCYPIRINGEIRGTNYHIPLSILEENAGKF